MRGGKWPFAHRGFILNSSVKRVSEGQKPSTRLAEDARSRPSAARPSGPRVPINALSGRPQREINGAAQTADNLRRLVDPDGHWKRGMLLLFLVLFVRSEVQEFSELGGPNVGII